ncbi:glycosyltransferase family 2 protein [Microvirga aerilata]|uniref:glycosyltransferase family 2 protein n=1 Tax=Microvirga aerilata TaxID=670292 RepID=UPI003635778D
MIDVSFVVCTRDRGSRITDTLKSIERAIEYCPDTACEIVIVNNASTDDTDKHLIIWSKKTRVNHHIVFEARPGVCRARNAGAHKSTGRNIVFTDDDCILARDYCRNLLGAHELPNDSAYLRGGRVELGDENDLPITVKTSKDASRLKRGEFPGDSSMAATWS